VRRWYKKYGSMLGMSEAVHTMASRCRAITSTIWSCASWLRDLPSLNFLPPISFSSTSSAGSGQSSCALLRLLPLFCLGQFVCHVRDDNQLLEVHLKVVSGGGIFLCTCLGMRLPCLIWRLLPRGFLLCRGLVYPHGLRTTSSPRSDRADASALFCDLFFCDDVGYDFVADLVERLWATPYQRITKGS